MKVSSWRPIIMASLVLLGLLLFFYEGLLLLVGQQEAHTADGA